MLWMFPALRISFGMWVTSDTWMILMRILRLYGTWAGGSAAMNLLIWPFESYGIYSSLLDITGYTGFHYHHDYDITIMVL